MREGGRASQRGQRAVGVHGAAACWTKALHEKSLQASSLHCTLFAGAVSFRCWRTFTGMGGPRGGRGGSSPWSLFEAPTEA